MHELCLWHTALGNNYLQRLEYRVLLSLLYATGDSDSSDGGGGMEPVIVGVIVAVVVVLLCAAFFILVAYVR